MDNTQALREAAEQALRFIKATNKTSSFWLVPESELNKTVTALDKALSQPPAPEQASGEISPAPCDKCGYNGPGYYQPDTHPCAATSRYCIPAAPPAAPVAAPQQQAEPRLQWCEHCGEGVTDFCRGMNTKCAFGFAAPQQQAQGEPSLIGDLRKFAGMMALIPDTRDRAADVMAYLDSIDSKDAENAKLRAALDGCVAALQVADSRTSLVWPNKEIQKAFRAAITQAKEAMK